MTEATDEEVTEASPATPASWTLAAVLAAVFVAQLAFGATSIPGIVQMGATYPGLIEDGAWWALLSSTLLHLGYLHIAANAAFVAIVGSRVEAVVGSARMLVIFFVGGTCGSVLSVWLNPDVVSAGASGGAWGLMLAELGLIGMPALRGGRPAPATWSESLQLVGINGVLSVLPGINGLAHLGGGVGGWVALVLSVVGGWFWALVATGLAVLHGGALGYAMSIGQPWRGWPPLGEPAVHELEFATLTLPETLVLDEPDGWSVLAKTGRHDGITLGAEVQLRELGEPKDHILTVLEGDPESLGDCGPDCVVRRWTYDSGTELYVSVQAFGRLDLITSVAIPGNAPESYRQWGANVADIARIGDVAVEGAVGLATDARLGGRPDEAKETLEAVLRARPADATAHNSLAWLYATHPDARVRDGARAVLLAERAVALEPASADYIDTLAAALAESGDLARAIQEQERAVALAPDRAELQEHLEALQAGEPIREGLPD